MRGYAEKSWLCFGFVDFCHSKLDLESTLHAIRIADFYGLIGIKARIFNREGREGKVVLSFEV